jgi:NADH:flavin oxidoreductase / NADH oxidase family
MDASLRPLFEPFSIRHVRFRNRFVSTSHAPGYAVGGNIPQRYVDYESEKAKGGVGLVQFGGATAVSIENSFHYGQINGAADAVIPQYRRRAAAIHRHGAACRVQLTHGGRRERWDDAQWLPAFAPSGLREFIHRSFPAEMEEHDFRRIHIDHAGGGAAGARGRPRRRGDLDAGGHADRAVPVARHESPQRRLWRPARQSHAFRARDPRGLPRGARRGFPDRHPHAR